MSRGVRIPHTETGACLHDIETVSDALTEDDKEKGRTYAQHLIIGKVLIGQVIAFQPRVQL